MCLRTVRDCSHLIVLGHSNEHLPGSTVSNDLLKWPRPQHILRQCDSLVKSPFSRHDRPFVVEQKSRWVRVKRRRSVKNGVNKASSSGIFFIGVASFWSVATWTACSYSFFSSCAITSGWGDSLQHVFNEQAPDWPWQRHFCWVAWRSFSMPTWILWRLMDFSTFDSIFSNPIICRAYDPAGFWHLSSPVWQTRLTLTIKWAVTSAWTKACSFEWVLCREMWHPHLFSFIASWHESMVIRAAWDNATGSTPPRAQSRFWGADSSELEQISSSLAIPSQLIAATILIM